MEWKLGDAQQVKKIVWSLDAFEQGQILEQRVEEALLAIVRGSTSTRVTPVYVLSPDQLNLGAETALPWIEQYRPAAEAAVKDIVRKFNCPGLLKPKVLTQDVGSTSAAVTSLAEYAVEIGADLILVGTHGRQGMHRFFLGSFAERLLLHSKVPVLVVNPKSKVSRFDQILFPTDLSRASRTLFRRVVVLACELKAKLTVYHVVQNPIDPVLKSGVYLMGGGWIPASDYLEEELSRRKKSAEHWVKIARKMGVEVEVVLETSRETVATSIVRQVERRKINLVAIAAQSGPLASAVIGSVTRHLVREAPCPVWVLHTRRASK
ncbi:MAG: hypothetical protein A2428_02280 [Bdellovibrionales bacterium RIFOXYC1_FULL_54_43]|nr:MAG: hypothetical protein A2428_02280 [Bdellovibrionales bacterium RIFOXYC1_FULL_54_43]OFZ84317.1 MAG: hypothetical protein A2603_07365 [Bdellovibrionales bacterium RIFOXYD1_FULL_55_31]